MRVFKEDGKLAKKIRRIEDFLSKENVEISFRGDGLLFTVDGKTVVLIDGETSNLEQTFPPFCDGTKIQTIEDYINGT